MEGLEALNNTLFLAINGREDAPAWLSSVAYNAGENLIYLVPLLLVALWLQGSSHGRGLALRAFLVAMLALSLAQLIGLFWEHPRPFVVGLGHTWIEHVPDSSFPSDHVTVLCSLAFTFFLGRAWAYGVAALACAFAVAWGRIFLGVHYPLDMVGAALVSAVALALLAKPWVRFGAALTGWAEAAYRRLFAWPIAAGWMRK